ncbi:MAG: VWA domain-containing protein [Alphaproteobacteria bacterium]|nr:VWA domain-containing protein [Alphaproteobacteria bacterium]MCZ6763606.1 VWA domain-containing protein [Alphaproteobacteria bacterium]
MAGGKKLTSRKPSASTEVADFLNKVATAPRAHVSGRRGRLMFAIDATASREPTWDLACQIQAEMFSETKALGGLDIQLCFYRGFGEFKKTDWMSSADELIRRMVKVRCLAGRTQIAKLLRHAIAETTRAKVDALVFVGDVVEEDVDALGHLAGELGLLGTPAFIFHEGGEPSSARVMQQIAQLSGGAYSRFDAGSAGQLKALLTAVAVYSAGGRPALEDYSRRVGGQVPNLTKQIAPPKKGR